MTREGSTPLTAPPAELQQLRQEVELLRAQRQQLLEQQTQPARTIEQLQHQLQHLLRRLYGRSAEKLDPKQMQLFDRMVKRVLQSKVIHTDDTPVDGLDRNRTQTRTGRFWVYLGDPNHPFTVCTYTPSRSRDGSMEFLKNWGQDQPVYLEPIP